MVMKPIFVRLLRQGWMPPVLLQLPNAPEPMVEVTELWEQWGDERVTLYLLLLLHHWAPDQGCATAALSPDHWRSRPTDWERPSASRAH